MATPAHPQSMAPRTAGVGETNKIDIKPDLILTTLVVAIDIRHALDAGCWAGTTLYPTTKCTPERANDMIEMYGPERLMVNTSGDWGPSRPDNIPEFILAMRRRGHPDSLIRRIVYENPIEFFRGCKNFDFTEPV